MNKTEFAALLREVDRKNTAYSRPIPGKPYWLRIDRVFGGGFSVYRCYGFSRDCVAADISKTELEKLLID